MALGPNSEEPDLPVPDDYHADHPHEHPSDWGWHGEFGRAGRIAGWVVVIILLLMTTATHYNLQGALFLGLTALALAVMLIWDWNRRRNAWRK